LGNPIDNQIEVGPCIQPLYYQHPGVDSSSENTSPESHPGLKSIHTDVILKMKFVAPFGVWNLCGEKGENPGDYY
jgi:hypothetical protein